MRLKAGSFNVFLEEQLKRSREQVSFGDPFFGDGGAKRDGLGAPQPLAALVLRAREHSHSERTDAESRS